MNALLFMFLLAIAFAGSCGYTLSDNCRFCKIDGGSICDKCNDGYYNGGVICSSCQVTKCATCSGSSKCLTCPENVLPSDYCNTCEEGKFYLDKDCVDPSVVGCAVADGSAICKCADDNPFCCKDDIGVRRQNATHCISCDVHCKTCSIKDCTECMDGYFLKELNLGGILKNTCLKSSANWLIAKMGILLCLLILL